MPGAGYLEDFQAKIKGLHRDPDKYCHWHKYEELTARTAVEDRGPCNCPSVKGSPCTPHACLSCASTTDVLARKPHSLDHYEHRLEKLKTAVDALADGIAAGQEAYDKGIDNGDLPSEILAKDLSFLTSGYWGVNSKEYKAVKTIAALKLDLGPSDGKAVRGCRCVCFDNKLARLEKEKDAIKKLIAEADEMSPAVTKSRKDLTATFSNTVLPVLKGSIKVVGGLFSGELEKSVDGAKELLKHLDETAGEGGQLFVLLKTAAALGDMKRLAMLGVIYHDQQLAAPTCMPSHDDDDDGEIDGGSTEEHRRERTGGEEVPYSPPEDASTPRGTA